MTPSLSTIHYWTPLISGGVTLALIAWMLKSPFLTLPLDHPGHRSLHDTPLPRTGGIAIVVGIFLGAILLPWDHYGLLIALLPLLVVSFWDDLRGLPAGWRFAAHFLSAALFVALALPDLDFLLRALLVIAIVWVINLYNFMDGSDGLAGGMTVIGFGFYGLSAWLSHDLSFALLNFSIAAAACAFLIFNFPPARIFMGDVGSIPLGFLAAALGLLGWQRHLWSLWLPLLVFSPFIVDASLTLMKRLIRREKIWLAHREHYYQRLVLMGVGHRNTALIEYVVMLAFGGVAIWGQVQPKVQSWLVAGCCLFYLIALPYIDQLWRKAAFGTAQRD